MNEIILKITAENCIAGEKQHMVIERKAFYRKVNGTHVFKYLEEQEDGSRDTVLVKIHPDKLTVVRKGIADTEMIFEEGKKKKARYITPAGNVDMEIFTRKITTEKILKGKELEAILRTCAEYDIYTGGSFISENKVVIECSDINAGL